MTDEPKQDQPTDSRGASSSPNGQPNKSGMDQARNVLSKAEGIARQGINAAKKKFDDAGGVEGVKSRITTFVHDVKTGFVADAGSTGFKSFVSRIRNLWRSGSAGKATIVATCFFCIVALANVKGSSSGKNGDRTEEARQESTSRQSASPQSLGWTSGSDTPSTSRQDQKQKMKTVGFWVCSQCGSQIESSMKPSGRCPSRNNAPHGWVRKGESKVPDTGQKETIWQCAKCFTVMTRPGGAPPTGIRCPAEKNAPHRFDKIGEK